MTLMPEPRQLDDATVEAIAAEMAEAWGRSDPADEDDIWLFCATVAAKHLADKHLPTTRKSSTVTTDVDPQALLAAWEAQEIDDYGAAPMLAAALIEARARLAEAEALLRRARGALGATTAFTLCEDIDAFLSAGDPDA